MKSLGFWKSVGINYLGITVIVFILFDLFIRMDGSQAFNPIALIVRIPIAIGLTFFTRWDRSTREREQAKDPESL